MPGLGVITTRITGETIDAAKYNGDRNELVNMMEPAQIDDYSANASQSNETLDPGAVASEVLAVNLRDEIKQLRYQVAALIDGTNWRTKTVTKTRLPQLIPDHVANAATFALRDTLSDVLSAYFRIPHDYASGNITVTLVERGAVTGTAVIKRTLVRIRDATARTIVENAVAMNFVAADTNSHYTTHTINSSDFQAGDYIRIDYQRFSADGSDNLAGDVFIDGCSFAYTGYPGR
jgi:hypothetical protein